VTDHATSKWALSMLLEMTRVQQQVILPSNLIHQASVLVALNTHPAAPVDTAQFASVKTASEYRYGAPRYNTCVFSAHI
jgi:hypothetical protein